MALVYQDCNLLWNVYYELFGRRGGDLNKIWVAGTIGDRKLTRSVVKYNLVQLCNNVRNTQVPFSLAIQAILLRGIVKIEGKQVSFLFSDAVDARTKLGNVLPTAGEGEEGEETTETKRKRSSRPALEAGEAEGAAELLEGLDTSLNIDLQLPTEASSSETRTATQQILHLAERLGEGEHALAAAGTGIGMGVEGYDFSGMDLGQMDLSALEGGLGLELGGLGLDEHLPQFGEVSAELGLEQPPPSDFELMAQAEEGMGLGELSDLEQISGFGVFPDIRVQTVADRPEELLVGADAGGTATAARAATAAVVEKVKRRGLTGDKNTRLPDSVLARNLQSVAPFSGIRNVKRLRVAALEDGFAPPSGETADFIQRLVSLPPCSEFYEWDMIGKVDPGIRKFWRSTCRAISGALEEGVEMEAGVEGAVGTLYGWHREREGEEREMEVGGWDVLEEAREGGMDRIGFGEGVEVGRGEKEGEEKERKEEGTDIELDLSGLDSSLNLDSSQESLGMGVGHISIVPASQIPDFEDVPLSQIELPVVPVSPRSGKRGPESEVSVSGIPNVLSKVTLMFVDMLATSFTHYRSDDAHIREGMVWVSLDEVLTLAAGDLSRVSDHDAAVSFAQLLALATMQAVTVVQQRSYRNIYIAKGPRWAGVRERQRRQSKGKKRARDEAVPEVAEGGGSLSQGDYEVDSFPDSLDMSQSSIILSQY